MSYIEKEKASQILREEAVAHYPSLFHVGLYAAAMAIDSIPAADVREVKRGKWNAVKGALHPAETSAVCSNCGFATMIHAQTFYNFCPNCGARMEES